ncbi:MAG: hypothetical protein AAGJ28_25580 [Pseudomonadota bacterium]
MCRAVFLALLIMTAVPVTVPASNTDQRVLVVREKAEASLMDGAFSFRLLKIKGYSVDIRVTGEKRRTLKIGQSFGPASDDCRIVFKKISPETRIARFLTDCP